MSIQRVIKNPNFAFRTALLALASVAPAFGQYGALDGSFTPVLESPGALGQACYGIVQQSDRSLLVFGAFQSVNDYPENDSIGIQHISKFSPGGVLDREFYPQPNAYVNGVVAEPDGTMLAGGGFSVANTGLSTQLPRQLIAKFSSTGEVDGTFRFLNPGGLTSVNNLASHQRTGYVVAANAGLFRLDNDGAVDTTFKVYQAGAQATVWAARPHTDNKILINGSFTGTPSNVGSGVNNIYLERLALNGGPDSPAFTPNPAIAIYTYATAIQADGKILVGGAFGPNSGYPLTGLTRLLTTGSAEAAFAELHEFDGGRPFIDGAVRCIALQADGKILIGGDFVNIRTGLKINNVWQYVERRGIARLNTDGSLDTTFNANITGSNFTVNCITIQDTGHILIGGTFQIVNGTSRPLAARLINYPATQSLTYEAGKITWSRGGSAPEASSVTLEYRSAVANSPWTLVDNIGIAVRDGTSGNWIRNVVSAIPAYSYIRASARVSGGTYSGSSGVVSQTLGYKIPRISLRRDTPLTPLANGGSTSFESVGIGRPKDLTFTLTNTGDGAMSVTSTQVTGGQANQFSIVTGAPSTLAIGASATIVVRFNPTSTGNKTTTFRINSNSPDSPQFNITLNGTAVTEMEGFRYEYFGSTANSGNGADAADPDGDGHTNLFEFIAGLIPNDRTSKFEQRVDRSSGTPKVIFSPIVANRTYEVQTNTNLGTWVAATGGSTSTNGAERTYTHTGATDPKRFYRIKITK